MAIMQEGGGNVPSGTWSFLHEWVIYEYLMFRQNENQLRLKQVIKIGNPSFKKQSMRVMALLDIRDTKFPDIKGIQFEGNIMRPAEVKFRTSLFDYHKPKYKEKYDEFIKSNGCIIVLKHDYLPEKLIQLIDVFEIEEVDFISFVKGNFNRLLNRQMNSHNFTKIWLMIQSKNFYTGADDVNPAYVSGIWCPTDNLTGFDLSVNDKVIFIRTSGCSFQKVNNALSNNIIYKPWNLQELWVGKVTKPIQSRIEYCFSNKKNIDDPLWYDETNSGLSDNRVTKRKREKRWKRVFGFTKETVFSSLNISLSELYKTHPEFVRAVANVFIPGRGSQEVTIPQYISVLESMINLENKQKNDLQNSIGKFQDNYESLESGDIYL
jgi:hypothetical protein